VLALILIILIGCVQLGRGVLIIIIIIIIIMLTFIMRLLVQYKNIGAVQKYK